MDKGLAIGLCVFLLAAICNGAFAFPHKFVKGFAWENTWGSFWFFAMVLIPLLVLPLLVRDVFAIWHAAGTTVVAKTIVYGALWGLGCITFGIGISAIGLSLGFSIIMGLAIGVGSLLPLLVLHREVLATPAGYVSIAGIAVSIVGVGLCGYAGVLKERCRTANNDSRDSEMVGRSRMGTGIAICVLSGVLSACMNLGFAFAQQITDLARAPQYGNSAWSAGLVSWILIFLGGFCLCGPFCVGLMFKNSTWNKFTQSGACRDFGLTFAMGVLQFLVIFLYGVGAYHMGTLGTSLGYAVFMVLGIAVANLLGFLTGEWKGADRKSLTWLAVALVVLFAGVSLLSTGNAIRQQADVASSQGFESTKEV